ncbi:MAG: transposase, partial [Firmicutes bacterium]|nr:transposase [Bacillota bacterium]
MRPKVSKPADMITVPGRIYPDETAKERLVSFMRRFQAAKRTAYQALRRGKKPGEIVKDLYRKFFP